jgi:hypothetical protein
MKRRYRIVGASICWMPRYLWIGAYWSAGVDLGRRDRPLVISVFVCLLPCLPLALRFEKATVQP